MVVGEQTYKSRDMVGLDSGLGHLLVKSTKQKPAVVAERSLFSFFYVGPP